MWLLIKSIKQNGCTYHLNTLIFAGGVYCSLAYLFIWAIYPPRNVSNPIGLTIQEFLGYGFDFVGYLIYARFFYYLVECDWAINK